MVGTNQTGMYDDGEHKHDCSRPLTGCDYPNCTCEVDDNAMTHQEKQQVEEEAATVQKAKELVNDE